MGDYGPFGFDPEEFDRVVRDASQGVRDAVERFGRFFTAPADRAGWSALFDEFTRSGRERETTGRAGDGVWAIYTVDKDGGARIEQVYPSELDALRANRDNTDPGRRVRFLPYGIAVAVLDTPDESD
jgi:hypothetical protein